MSKNHSLLKTLLVLVDDSTYPYYLLRKHCYFMFKTLPKAVIFVLQYRHNVTILIFIIALCISF